MNESATAIAVLRTRMPYVDRRSLSEAWFSALHLAARPESQARSIPAVPPPLPASGVHAGRSSRAVVADGDAACTVPSAARRRATFARSHPAAAAPRYDRPQRRGLAACAAVARSYPAQRTSLTLAVGGSRVALVLRREGAVLHVVALCRADVAPLVRRALAAAGEHLRRSGDCVRASVRVDERTREA